MKLGILLTTSPEKEDKYTVIKFTESALNSGIEVNIFLMCDGIYNINDKAFLSLLDKGANITVCAQNAYDKDIPKREGILFGSQYDLAVIVNESDRFLSFT
jgi:sulfur relay (sulfurtransferase) complex TusBCD TusD component (DsrE family)